MYPPKAISKHPNILAYISNITQGYFIHAAADNIDINEETVDGKATTHATSLVLYQRQPVHNGQFGYDVLAKNSVTSIRAHSRTLQERIGSQIDREFGVSGRRPTAIFQGLVNLQWYHQEGEAQKQATNIDMAWLLVHMCPLNPFQVDLFQDPKTQNIPGWTPFNAIVSSEFGAITSFGFCAIIYGSPSEYNTVHSVMTTVQKMMASFGQDVVVITLDEAIYSKAKEIQCRMPEQFDNVVLRMGGFHIAMNFLATIGHIYKESGLEDLIVESGLHISSSTAAIMKGKMYNRAVRAHKLMLEVMMRLKWVSFNQWLINHGQDDNVNHEMTVQQITDLHTAIKEEEGDLVRDIIGTITEKISAREEDMQRFSIWGTTKSQTFLFWDNYIEMVFLLLQYIRAEREANWELHLATVAEMIPYFFICDHVNYARWVTVYLANMHLLTSSAPFVHEQFKNGAHAVSQTGHKFSQVWSDMALEQSANCDTKSKGGVIGFTKKHGALDKWFLTAHEHASVRSQTKKMLGVHWEIGVQHKEASKPRTA